MDFLWLEDFLSLSKTGSFSKSAQERNITQPAFGRRIRALERWIGVPLVDRKTYPAQLTAEGKIFRETAHSIVKNLNRDRNSFKEALRDQDADLRIVAASTLNTMFIPGWIKSLSSTTGPISVQLKTRRFNEMAQSLLDGDFDLIMQYAHEDVPILFDKTTFDQHTICQEQFVLVSPINPKTKEPLLHPDQGSDVPLPYVGYSKDGYFSDIVELLFEANKVSAGDFRKVNESPGANTVKKLALAFNALAFLPFSAAQEELERGNFTIVGGKSWSTNLKVNLYRSKASERKIVTKIWNAL